MKNADTIEIQTVELERLDVNQLPELQGWKDTQLKLVKENPFVEITDNKTYEEGKKARTALVTARTTIEKQEKAIASKLKDFRTRVSEASKELIDITLPHEEKQQEEVKRYEAIKEAERLEKERIEKERRDSILMDIDLFYEAKKYDIQTLLFYGIDDFKTSLSESIKEMSKKDFEEFDIDFAEKVNLLYSQLKDRETYLTEKEEQRIENERLAKEREKLEAERKAREAEYAAREKQDREAKEAEERKMRAEREKLEAERAAIEKEKAEHRAKLEAEQRAKEEAERKAREEAEKLEAKKRADALKPDIEKLKNVISNIGISMEAPEFKNQSAMNFYTEIKMSIEDLKKELSNGLSTIN